MNFLFSVAVQKAISKNETRPKKVLKHGPKKMLLNRPPGYVVDQLPLRRRPAWIDKRKEDFHGVGQNRKGSRVLFGWNFQTLSNK